MHSRCPHCLGVIADDREPLSDDLTRCDCEGTITESAGTVSYAPRDEASDPTYVPDGLEAASFVPSSLGDYELLEELARGGMGIVYRARQRSLNRIVALKMIRSGELAGPEEVARFRAEAEAAAHLDHPGIVPVYEVGEHNGQHFLSMALIEGGSLADELTDGPVPPRQAAEVMQRVAEAVEFAHEQGVIHRDLKPRNILIDKFGKPRVTDFGLAKNLLVDSDLTITGQIVGTPAYMSPEQAHARDVGPSADIYSLGATLYCLLTGRPPFQSATPHETLRQVTDDAPLPVRTLNRSIPVDLETICLKCLRKEPAQRYESAAALAQDLERWLKHEPIRARPVSRTEKAWLWLRRRPAIAAAIATIVVTLSAATLMAVMLRRGEDHRRSLEAQLAWERYLEQVLWIDRIATMARSGDYHEAVAEGERLLQRDGIPPSVTYDVACVFSLAAETASADEALSPDERDQLSSHLADRAMHALRQARDAGYFGTREHVELLVEDPDLSSVRRDPGFAGLLKAGDH